MARTIAHLSDLHFGTEDPSVVAALAADIAQIRPDLVAVSGDLTQGARHREYEAAMRFLGALPAPVLAVPGNHDITPYHLVERFLDPWRRWRRHVGPQTEPVFEDAEMLVVGVNTANRAQPHLRWQHGRLHSWRLRRAEARLAAAAPGRVRVVVAHHPFAAPALNPSAALVGGAGRALAAFARQGVALVLTGHLHLPDVNATRQGGVLLVQAATATSRRLRGTPNAWNLIEVAPGAAPRITTRSWDGQAWRGTEPQVIRVEAPGPA